MPKTQRPAVPHVYRARDGWRWRMLARNARIIAEWGEAFTSRRSAERSLGLVIRAAAALHEVTAWPR
jgi:uncharacterized protein YegP (UPF0339 family)